MLENKKEHFFYCEIYRDVLRLFPTYRQCKSVGPVKRGREVATTSPVPHFGGAMWCFLQEDKMSFDVTGAAEWFEAAVQQLIESDVDEDEVPFLLFLCGAEAALRTQEEDTGVLH